MLDLKRLSVFREIVRRGSFSAAADALNYSQPAISHHISRLELQLGAQVLERSRDGVTLTPAGRALLAHAEVLLARAGEAEDQIARIVGGEGPSVRLGAFATASATVVAETIGAFRTTTPDVPVTLLEGDPADTLEALRGRHLDLGVVFDDPQHPLSTAEDVVIEHLLDDPMLLVLPPGHPLAEQERVELADLAREPFIEGAGEETPASLILMAACQRAGFEPRIAFNSGNFHVVQELVAIGVGVALVPALALVRPHPDVLIRAIAPPAPARRVGVAYRQAAADQAHVAALLVVLRASGRRWRGRVAGPPS
jgi:DNA-binding transcriptional LysR family regulator